MKFRKKESEARRSSRWLVILFIVVVLGMVFVTNAVMALVWKAVTFGATFPAGFFESNTFLVFLYVFGSCAIETLALKKGGDVLAERAGGIELDKPDNIYEKRLRNVVMEVAVATGIRPPRVFVLNQEEAINAFAAGWDTQDAVIAVTRGATERLTRDELQGVVAHEFSHILNGDMRLNMRLMSMVFGLQMLYNYGHEIVDRVDDALGASFRFGVVFAGAGYVIGYTLMAIGWVGWLAGSILSASVSRQREYLADASAVKYTRFVDGLAGALRKIAYQQQNQRGQLIAVHDVVQMAPLFLHFEADGKWLATHPSIAERLKHLGVSYTKFQQKDDVQSFKKDQFMPARLLAGGELTPHLKMAAARWGGVDVTKSGAVDRRKEVLSIEVPQGNHMTQIKAELYLKAHMDLNTLRAAIMAFWVPAGDKGQENKWKEIWQSSSEGQVPYKVLVSVQDLAPIMYEPVFEQLAMRMQTFELKERIQLVAQAEKLYLNQLNSRPIDWLRLAVLAYWMGEFRESMSSKYVQMHEIQSSVALITSFMANALNLDEQEQWTCNVLQDLELTGQYQEHVTREQLDQAVRDIHDGVSLFAPILIKVWLKQWRGVAISRADNISQHDIDVFRLMCALLDTVCPEEILRHYDT